MRSPLAAGSVLIAVALSAGCAVHVESPRGTEQIWGIGGMAVREIRSAEGVKAAARSTTLFGLMLGRRTDASFVGFGWQRFAVLDVAEPGAVLDVSAPRGWLGLTIEDPVSGALHYWGIGYLRMHVPAPASGHAARVEERRALGFGGSFGRPGRLMLGWERAQWFVPVQDDVAVRIEWPSGGLLDAVIGTRPPLEPAHHDPRGRTRE
jgi:hypothetical protein